MNDDQCPDKSVTYLASKGLNVARTPSTQLKCNLLIGHQNDTFSYLGPVTALLVNSPSSPSVALDQTTADFNGLRSDSIPISAGITILSNLLTALGGGSIGANLNFTNAASIVFNYQDVVLDSVNPTDIGKYVENQTIDNANPVIAEYVRGNGQLYIVTDVAKSRVFSVKFLADFGANVSVKVQPLIDLGGAVSVTPDSQDNSTITFAGTQRLGFGFKCFQVVLQGTSLRLVNSRAGTVVGLVAEPPSFVVDDGPLRPHILRQNALIRLGVPNAIGAGAP